MPRSPTLLTLRSIGWILILLFCSGCGGGGSGSAGTGTLETVLTPTRISQEGSGDLDAIFAAVKGPGVTGGYLEDTVGQKILGSDLQYENVTGRYEVILKRNAGSFPFGTYTLRYFQSGETKGYSGTPLDWTLIPRFAASPTQTYSDASRILTVRYPLLSGANVRYLLQLYSETGFFRRETFETSSTEIQETILDRGTYAVLLVANGYEGSVLKWRVMFTFGSQTYGF